MQAHDLEALRALYTDSAKVESTGFDKPAVGGKRCSGIVSQVFLHQARILIIHRTDDRGNRRRGA